MYVALKTLHTVQFQGLSLRAVTWTPVMAERAWLALDVMVGELACCQI